MHLPARLAAEERKLYEQLRALSKKNKRRRPGNGDVGEEPYTLAILWRVRVAPQFAGVRMRIVATDAEPEMIERAVGACYPSCALRDLPTDLATGFSPVRATHPA